MFNFLNNYLFKFFVSFDNSVTNDRLWHDKYNLRTAQIPSFISEKQARKVIKKYYLSI